MSSKTQPPIFIQGEKIILKARSHEQANELFALVDSNRDHLKPWMPWEESTKTIDDTIEYINLTIIWWKSNITYDYAIVDKFTNKMIGSFGIHSIDWQNKTAELGYWLDQKQQGKGLITEAVKLGEQVALDLELHRIVITCDRLNEKSQQVPLRCGYKLEAIQIDEVFNRDHFRDTLRFVKLINPPIEGRITENLPIGFSIKETSPEDFNKIVGNLEKELFDLNEMTMWPSDVMSEQEKSKLTSLNEHYKNYFSLRLVLYCDDKLAGWTRGYQDSRESFCMQCSVVLPEYRGRGLYSNLLDNMLSKLSATGFQRIWSLHKMNNNRIIIPKLKKSFVITGTRLSDMAGVLVELTYFTNETRKKVYDFRMGSRPDEEIKAIFKMNNNNNN